MIFCVLPKLLLSLFLLLLLLSLLVLVYPLCLTDLTWVSWSKLCERMSLERS